MQSMSFCASAYAGQECVGRYELTIPGNADIALTIPAAFSEPQEDPIRFSNGQAAPHSVFIYDGTFRITSTMSHTDFNSVLDDIKTRVSSSATSTDVNNRFEVIPQNRPGAFAWAGHRGAGFYLYESGHAVSFRDSSSNPVSARQRTRDILKNLVTYHQSEIPSGDGVCLPGIFIGDNGKDSARQVGVTYRLTEHPDVTIFFLDEKAVPAAPKLNSKQKTEFVWGYEYGIGKRIKLHGLMPYGSVKLDGREGTETSATITRDDDSTDYGYLAIVRGDPDASVDTPHLLLLVERNAKNANGNVPVSAEELDRIAKGVAASIRRRGSQS
jgi:hypothetical protein